MNKKNKLYQNNVIVGIGANLVPVGFENILSALEHIIKRITYNKNISLKKISSWYKTEPIPRSDQPNFINGVLHLETNLKPHNLLKFFKVIELEFGRIKTKKNEPRVVDLDILFYNNLVISDIELVIPHPRITERRFVLEPLNEIAPEWEHPVNGKKVKKLLEILPKDFMCEKI